MGEATLVQFPLGLELRGGLVQEEVGEREWGLSSPPRSPPGRACWAHYSLFTFNAEGGQGTPGPDAPTGLEGEWGLAWGRKCPVWGWGGKPTPTATGRFL